MSDPIAGVGPRGTPGLNARSPKQVADEQIASFPYMRNNAENIHRVLNSAYWGQRKETAQYRRIRRAAEEALRSAVFSRSPEDLEKERQARSEQFHARINANRRDTPQQPPVELTQQEQLDIARRNAYADAEAWADSQDSTGGGGRYAW